MFVNNHYCDCYQVPCGISWCRFAWRARHVYLSFVTSMFHKCVKKKIIKQINPYLVNSTVVKNKSKPFAVGDHATASIDSI